MLEHQIIYQIIAIQTLAITKESYFIQFSCIIKKWIKFSLKCNENEKTWLSLCSKGLTFARLHVAYVCIDVTIVRDDSPGCEGGVQASQHPEHAEPAQMLSAFIHLQELGEVGVHNGDGATNSGGENTFDSCALSIILSRCWYSELFSPGCETSFSVSTLLHWESISFFFFLYKKFFKKCVQCRVQINRNLCVWIMQLEHLSCGNSSEGLHLYQPQISLFFQGF